MVVAYFAALATVAALFLSASALVVWLAFRRKLSGEGLRPAIWASWGSLRDFYAAASVFLFLSVLVQASSFLNGVTALSDATAASLLLAVILALAYACAISLSVLVALARAGRM
ncbi:MAG: hypothetical protein QXH27_02570 [Candidatus Micrarchaeia archaeon]